MARYTGPVCRLCRREGQKLYLKGQRCYTPKCPIEKKAQPPGQHGLSRRKLSEYGIHLREKQKARRFYGPLERQFRRYVAMAERAKGVTGERLLQILETRLDNVLFRMGFALSRKQARQFVLHGHVSVNGRKVNVPSYMVRQGDRIAVREKSRKMLFFKDVAEGVYEATVPEWLSVDREALTGEVLRMPLREEIDAPIQESLIVEHYSR
ncbi:MAG: 30S ribosomal protein S4 [Dactylosporangium sp.]|nr:30S ribosomal protein S4 [Dactylosporangium sp.]